MSLVTVPYDIVYCSSQDKQFPVSNLLRSSESVERNPVKGGGWQSIRGGRSPQTLVLRFPGNAVVQQIRILSHESKIASKVELRIYKLRLGETHSPPSFRDIRFSKLGTVEFNSNERSYYRSKERKTIHMKAEVYFLKLLFDVPHPNALNKANQVGVCSIECFGQIAQPILLHADGAIANGSGTTQAAPADTVERPVADAERGKAPMLEPGPSRGDEKEACQLGAPDSFAGTSEFSSFRSVRIVQFEDFFLHHSEELLRLEQQAVSVNDMTTAAKCRGQLNRLNSRSKRIYQLEQDKVQHIIEENFEGAKGTKELMDALIEKTFKDSHMPEPNGAPLSDEDDDGNDDHRIPPIHLFQPPTDRYIPAVPSEEGVVDLPFPGRVFPVEDAVLDRRNYSGAERDLIDAILQTTGEKEEGMVTVVPTSFDTRPLFATVGAFPGACLFSRRFKLREAALTVLTASVGRALGTPSTVLEAILRFLDYNSFGLQDAIPNVFFASCAFIRMALADEYHCINNITVPLSQLVPRLLTRAADTLPRVREDAMATLGLFVKTPVVHPSSLFSAVLADPVDRDRRTLPAGNPRAQLARLNLLSLMLDSQRCDIEGNIDNIVDRVLIPGVNHQSYEVRDSAVGILTSLIASGKKVLLERDLSRVNNFVIRELLQTHAQPA